MDLVELVYEITKKLPREENYALSDQLKRSAVSIPSNIAEGQKRLGTKEFKHFCGIALGSNAELETQLLLVKRLYSVDVTSSLEECEIISRMLTALAKKL